MKCEDFARKLGESLKSLQFEYNAALAFSGGLDSSIIAFLMKNHNPVLYTTGCENARDVKNSIEIANLIGLELKIIEYDEDEIIRGIRFLKKIDENMNPVEIGFELPLYFVLKNSKEKIVYCGQGADELFGGYKKYIEHPEKMCMDLEKLLDIGIKRESFIAKNLGKKLIYPYLDYKIVELSQDMPVECKIHDNIRKWVLRRAAEVIGVPKSIVDRKKKAAQYGSGVWKIMIKMAKKRRLKISEFIEKI